MPNSPIINQFYNNTSFTDEQNISLKSNFLHFGQTLAISVDLFKKRFANLFIPILVWQLGLFIIFVVIQIALGLSAINNLAPGRLANLPNPINEQTFEFNPAFNLTIQNLVKVPAVIGYLTAMAVVFVLYALLSTWIDFKTTLMLNDKSDKFLGSNLFLGRFWILILFTIVLAVVDNIISEIFNLQASPILSLVLGSLGFVYLLVSSYISKVASYVNSIYLIEQASFWDCFATVMRMVKQFLLVDFFKYILAVIFQIGALVCGFLVFGLVGLGLLFPLTNSTASNSGLGTLLIILFGLLMFLAVVFVLLLDWLTKCFIYTSYYNLRLLQLNNADSIQDAITIKTGDNAESSQTLEQKLMDNLKIDDFAKPIVIQDVIDQDNKNDSKFVKTSESDPKVEKPANDKQALAEYQMMDIEDNSIGSSKTEPTVIKSSLKPTINETSTILPVQDDFTIIEGIGPKIAELLNQNGINTFAQLGDFTIEDLKSILENGGSKFASHNPVNWPRQAELARDGKMAELEVLKEELNRGM
jgi:predicted flap endonuclease-1-like 5' DNA nuclease